MKQLTGKPFPVESVLYVFGWYVCTRVRKVTERESVTEHRSGAKGSPRCPECLWAGARGGGAGGSVGQPPEPGEGLRGQAVNAEEQRSGWDPPIIRAGAVYKVGLILLLQRAVCIRLFHGCSLGVPVCPAL